MLVGDCPSCCNHIMLFRGSAHQNAQCFVQHTTTLMMQPDALLPNSVTTPLAGRGTAWQFGILPQKYQQARAMHPSQQMTHPQGLQRQPGQWPRQCHWHSATSPKRLISHFRKNAIGLDNCSHCRTVLQLRNANAHACVQPVCACSLHS